MDKNTLRETLFTFHSGKIKTVTSSGKLPLMSPFTFHSGKIKTSLFASVSKSASSFTFHSGKIKTGQPTKLLFHRVVPIILSTVTAIYILYHIIPFKSTKKYKNQRHLFICRYTTFFSLSQVDNL